MFFHNLRQKTLSSLSFNNSLISVTYLAIHENKLSEDLFLVLLRRGIINLKDVFDLRFTAENSSTLLSDSRCFKYPNEGCPRNPIKK